MMGFLLVIFTSISIIGYSSIKFSTEQAYNQSYSRLEGYANSLEQIAVNQNLQIDLHFLDNLQIVMQGEDTTFRIFDKDNQMLYPQALVKWQLPSDAYKEALKGKVIHIKNDHENSQSPFSKKEAYTSVIVPWKKNGKVVGIIWVGSRVKNVEELIYREKRNIVIALLITTLVAIMMSFVLSFFISVRIKRLSNATKKVAMGDFDVQLPSKDSDEIDDLAKDFNIMVQSLKQSHKEIEAQEERRNHFMADAAHEMRTPLTTINGILEGLQYDAIPEEAKPKSINLMQSETKRLIRLVNENLDYEKIRNNQIILVKSEFDAKPILNNLLTQMKKKAEKAKDKLIVDCPNSVMTYADQDRFIQMLVNLVQNALQFTHNGKIIISGKRIEHGAEFMVSDTGIGMDQKQLKFIFDRFYKVDASRARLGSGESGLGLSIVSSLVKQHGGEIDVTSEPNKGSKFVIKLFDKGYEKK